MALHDLPLPQSCRGAVRFLQLPRAVITTDLDGFAADFDFEGIFIQLAVASCTSRSTMTLLSPTRSPGTRAVGHEWRKYRCQNL